MSDVNWKNLPGEEWRKLRNAIDEDNLELFKEAYLNNGLRPESQVYSQERKGFCGEFYGCFDYGAYFPPDGEGGSGDPEDWE